MSEETKNAVADICVRVAAGKVTAQGIALGVELAKAIIADQKKDGEQCEARAQT